MPPSIPLRPLRVKSSVLWKGYGGGFLLFSVGLAAAVGFGWWQFAAVQQLLQDSRIWSAGLTAPNDQVSGRETTHKGIFHEYDLEVNYKDNQGGSHHGIVAFDTLVTEVDQSSRPMVHYLKDSPDQFALSWAVDSTTSRWSSIIFMVLAGIGLVSGAFLFLGIKCLRYARLAQLCARRSEEVRLRITKVVPNMYQGKHVGDVYHFIGESADGVPLTGKTMFKPNQPPLFADPEGTSLLGLISPLAPKRPLVPAHDLHPFAVSPDERLRA